MASEFNPKLQAEALSVVVGNADQTAHKTGRIQRTLWLRAAILGASDGLISTASLMLGVGSAKDDDRWAMVISGIAGAVAGAFSMVVGEFVSVSTQRDIVADLKKEEKVDEEALPNPVKAAAASGSSFMVGSLVPLLSGSFVQGYQLRVGLLVAVTTGALAVFGGMGAYLGGSGRVKMSAARVLCGGWLAMGMTYWLLKLLDKD